MVIHARVVLFAVACALLYSAGQVQAQGPVLPPQGSEIESPMDHYDAGNDEVRRPAKVRAMPISQSQPEALQDPFVDDDQKPAEAKQEDVAPPSDCPSGRCPMPRRSSSADNPWPMCQADARCSCQSQCQCDCCCQCDCGACELNCCESEPRRLFTHLNQNGWEVNGWLSGGFTVSDKDAPSRFNGTQSFNDRQDEFQANQIYLTMGKAADTGGDGFAIGGRVDFFYGTDSRFTEARGLERRRDLSSRWNGQRFYGASLPQAYLEAAWNNLSVKFGHYYTIVGYETVAAPDNFFYSHSYTLQYAEPFTHTGILASYQLGEQLTFYGGVDRGWDNWEDDRADRLSSLGGVMFESDFGLTVGVTGTFGQEPTADGALIDDRSFYSFVARHEVTDRLTVVVQHDRGFQDRGAGSDQDAEWYGVNSYLYYKLDCCWTAGLRMEWFRDDDGTRVAAVGDRLNPNSNPASSGGFIGNFYALTAGLNWSPCDNLTVRPEARFDWYDPDSAGPLPFDDGRADRLVTGAIDFILRY